MTQGLCVIGVGLMDALFSLALIIEKKDEKALKLIFSRAKQKCDQFDY